MSKTKLWSVTRITHPTYPGTTVRVGEFEPGGTLHVFRQVNGNQRSRSLKVRRADLGRTPAQQVQEAKRLGCAFIEELVKAPAAGPTRPGVPLTFGQLADKYERDGFAGRTAQQAPLVTAAAVSRDQVYDVVEALGTTQANESVTLTAKVSDTVRRVNFEDGEGPGSRLECAPPCRRPVWEASVATHSDRS